MAEAEEYEARRYKGAFKKAAKELKINTDSFATDNYSFTKDLPWDFIDIKPDKEFLIQENQRLITSKQLEYSLNIQD